GGTGKTPLLKAMAEWCEARGHSACVVTRGYGADEVSLYRRWLGSDRALIAPERQEGLVRAARAGLDVALMDDGFQHRRASRSLDLLLVSADAPHPPRLLPWGPYREPLRSAGRADLVLVTHRPGGAEPAPWLARMTQEVADVPVLPLALGPLGWRPMSNDRGEHEGDGEGGGAAGNPWSAAVPDGSVLAVASTADPSGFLRLVRATRPDLDVELAPYPNHFEYGPEEARDLVRRAGQRSILTTEKDAVKLDSFEALRERAWVVGFGVAEPLPSALTTRLERVLEGTLP
ncbi:MAG: hypothetical protein HKO53_17980, partial [Gemmatimonadetes bacterium]|nr:hypothetical protein [Gemmatimonadota bacterium]